jgi:hypothetical protein
MYTAYYREYAGRGKGVPPALEEMKTRVSPELKNIGVNDMYQLSISPWIVYYKLEEENKKINS